jgi:hypothetical protein
MHPTAIWAGMFEGHHGIQEFIAGRINPDPVVVDDFEILAFEDAVIIGTNKNKMHGLEFSMASLKVKRYF